MHIKYHFELIRATIPEYKELAHIIHASSLTDAMQKFTRKHQLEMPAYWDEPTYDRQIDIAFKHASGEAVYAITW